MAFRILRLNGYDVSSGIYNLADLAFTNFLDKKFLNGLCYDAEPLTQFSEDHIFNYLGGHMKDISTILELYRASQFIIHPNESILEKQNFWTSHFLKQELSNGSIRADKLNKYIGQEVVFYNRPLYDPLMSCSISQGSSLNGASFFIIPGN